MLVCSHFSAHDHISDVQTGVCAGVKHYTNVSALCEMQQIKTCCIHTKHVLQDQSKV